MQRDKLPKAPHEPIPGRCAVQRVDALLEAVEVEEVAFQGGCQATELRAILNAALAAPQRKLAAMHARIRKHLGATAPRLAAQARTRWEPCLVCMGK